MIPCLLSRKITARESPIFICIYKSKTIKGTMTNTKAISQSNTAKKLTKTLPAAIAIKDAIIERIITVTKITEDTNI